MDNKKIGKLIADLRKKQGLTQQDLGDKVGVGFRAVSKWERGLTLPDITIINELSKILGITSDELLSGEVKKEKQNKEKKKLSPIKKILIIVVTLFVMISLSIFVYYNNKTYAYNMVTVDEDKYHIEGQVIFRGDEITIIISKLRFKEENIVSKIINNYEYEMNTKDRFLFGYGYTSDGKIMEESVTVEKIAQSFRINYTDKPNLDRKEVIENDIILTFNFLDQNNTEFTEEIEIRLFPLNDKK